MIVEGDSFALVRDLPTAAVDAVVTSPPYADLRGYGGAHPDVYHEWIAPLLESLLRVVKPTGSLMLNLGRVFRDGEEHPYVERTMLAARDVGWKRVDTLVWHKLNAHPFCAPRYLHPKHEYVYWLAPSVDCYRGYTAETRTAPSPETVARRGRAGLRGPKNRSRGGYVPALRTPLNPDGVKPSSVFACTVGREKGVQHDAPMALELARHLVALSCPPGGVVLDPFLGAGTTYLACAATGRVCIGFDHDPAAVAETRRRLAAGVQVDLLTAS